MMKVRKICSSLLGALFITGPGNIGVRSNGHCLNQFLKEKMEEY